MVYTEMPGLALEPQNPTPPPTFEEVSLYLAAQRAVRFGAIAGWVMVGGMTLIILIALFSGSTDERLQGYDSPGILLVVGAVALLVLGLHRRSRGCALSLLALGIANIILKVAEDHRVPSAIQMAMFAATGAAVWGTFTHHRIRRRLDTDYRRPGPLVVVLTGLALTASWGMAALIVLGEMGEMRVVPAMCAMRGAELLPEQRQVLIDAELLLPNERLIYLYSDSRTDITEDVCLFTDLGVLKNITSGEDPHGFFLYYDEIASLKPEYADDPEEYTYVHGRTVSDEAFVLFTAAEEGRDREFVRLLLEEWTAARYAAPD